MTTLYDGGVRTGRILLNRFVELTSTAPAKLFGMFPCKGTIAVGSDADIVLFDPEAQHTITADHAAVQLRLHPLRTLHGHRRTGGVPATHALPGVRRAIGANPPRPPRAWR